MGVGRQSVLLRCRARAADEWTGLLSPRLLQFGAIGSLVDTRGRAGMQKTASKGGFSRAAILDSGFLHPGLSNADLIKRLKVPGPAQPVFAPGTRCSRKPLTVPCLPAEHRL